TQRAWRWIRTEPSAASEGGTASSAAGGGSSGGGNRNSRASSIEANPMSPWGKPTTTENSSSAKIAFRQSSMLLTRNDPTTSVTVAAIGASARKASTLRRTS